MTRRAGRQATRLHSVLKPMTLIVYSYADVATAQRGCTCSCVILQSVDTLALAVFLPDQTSDHLLECMCAYL